MMRSWWAMGLRGLLALCIGVIAFAMPGITLTVFITLFGAYALVDGVFLIIGGVRAAQEHNGRFWVLAIQGALSLLLGIYAFARPLATATAFVFVVAIWAIVTGLVEIGAAMRLHRFVKAGWLLGLNGILSTLFGIALMLAPGAGLLIWVWTMGGFALISGCVLLYLAFRLRAHALTGGSEHLDPPLATH